MKTKKFLKVFSILVAIALTATTVLASPYVTPSFWMADPLDPGHEAPPEGTDPSTAVEGYWWRDTANQNAIAQQTADQFTGQAYQIYSSSKLKVFFYSSSSGANTVAVVTTNNLIIIGSGGSKVRAMVAKNALQRIYPPIGAKNLLGVIYTSIDPQITRGTEYWLHSFYSNPLAPVYASSEYSNAMDRAGLVAGNKFVRDEYAYGNFLTWGEDGFLGLGSGKIYNPSEEGGDAAWSAVPTITFEEETTLYSDSIPVTLIPTLPEIGGLSVWLPNQKILIPIDLFGRFLPNIAPLNGPYIPPERVMAVLDTYRTLQPVTLLPMHTMYISGNPNINAAWDIQSGALGSIHDQTLTYINQHHHIDDGDIEDVAHTSCPHVPHLCDIDEDDVPDDHLALMDYSVDDIVNLVQLPDNLASSPYAQEIAGTVASIVRAIFHEHVGWFGGNVIDLASTLTETVKAQTLAAAFSYPSLAEAAKQAELDARDLSGAEKALYLAFMAYKANPDDFTVKQIYAQALRKNAFMQKSAQIRNYYLMEALPLGTEHRVTDFAKSGDENTVITFTAADFSGHFFGISGASLETVKIVSLPANGVLALAGTSVTAGQEIPLADLGGLTFTPTDYWNGETSFTWNGATGGTYAPNDATVTITLTPVNEPPSISDTPLADVTVDEDATNSTIDLSAGFSDTDIATNGDVLTYTVTNSNTDLVSTAVDGSSLTLTYQPNKNGTATITVTATDIAGTSVSDDLAVTVNPINDAPTAQDASITVVAGKSQTITLDYGDLETTQANLQVTFGSLQGTLDTSALPTLTYTAPSTAGDDSFTYTVTDRGDPDGCTMAPCAVPLPITATVHVTVLPAPSASISGVIFNDANANGSLDDGEGGLADVVVQLQDANGSKLETFTTGADGAYTFTALDARSYQVYAPKDADRVQTTDNPIAVTLAEAQTVTGVNIGSVVSADLKVSMTYTVNNKKIIYAITVTNDGPADALSATLADTLPDTVAYISVISTQGTCSGGKTVNCSFGTIASGGTVTVTIQVNRVNTKVPIVNTATVSSSIFDIDIADNIVTKTVQ